jgi:glycosyltransferase involved in cell wall biosynthesis
MPRVLLVSGSLPPIRCGVGFYVQRLSRELAAEGVDFSVLSTSGVDEETFSTQLISGWQIRKLPKLLSIIKDSNADIIHIQYPAVGYGRQLGINLLPYVLRIFSRKSTVIVTLHEYFGSRWIGRFRDLITIAPVHKILLTNRADLDALPRRLANRVAVIPLGSSVDRTKPNKKYFDETLSKHGLDTEKNTLLYFGFSFPTKRLEILADAMREKYLQEWQLLLLTTLDPKDKYHRKLLGKIEDNNKGFKRVAVTGFLTEPEISSILQQGRYFVLPQIPPLTAKSSTAITAIQHNMILISQSARADISLPFAHLKNCYLLESLTAEDVALSIEWLERSPEARNKIKKGMKDLQSYFSWDTIVQKHIKLYENLNGKDSN